MFFRFFLSFRFLPPNRYDNKYIFDFYRARTRKYCNNTDCWRFNVCARPGWNKKKKVIKNSSNNNNRCGNRPSGIRGTRPKIDNGRIAYCCATAPKFPVNMTIRLTGNSVWINRQLCTYIIRPASVNASKKKLFIGALKNISWKKKKKKSGRISRRENGFRVG